MSELPDECDFCGQTLDDDEELVPVFIGKPPTPAPQRLEKFKNKSDRFEYQLQGRSISAHAALYEALMSEDNIELELSDAVYEAETVQFAGKIDDAATRQGFQENVNRDKAAAKVTIYPDFGGHQQPDMEVCEHCECGFKEEAQR